MANLTAMLWGRGRVPVVAVGAAALSVMFGGIAAAVSDGNYDHARQNCTADANESDYPDRVEPDCQNLTINVQDGNGAELVRAGTHQTADGEWVHEASATAEDPEEFDPSTGASFYFGADDNLDNGEHDSSTAVEHGPSDGGAIRWDADPARLDAWMNALSTANFAYLLSHPLPLVAAGVGACADGVCFSAVTERSLTYLGGDGTKVRDAADYEGKEWDPESCSGPSDTEDDCGPGGLGAWAAKEGAVYAEPGVQIYEDPDPEASPIGPYPLPAAYAGTCGVIFGGGPAMVPASPVTNGAGQVAVKFGC